MKKIFISILVSLVFLSFSYSQSEYQNPFEPLLPQKKVEEEDEGGKEAISEAAKSLPSIVVQGILWGSDSPQVIIDGKVYKVGDKLKKIDAQIFRIDKGVVFISYEGKIYRVEIGKKEKI